MTAIGPGSVVVCVNPKGLSPHAVPVYEGARYVVRAMHEGRKSSYGKSYPPLLLLRGIYNVIAYDGLEAGYDIDHFRPIDDSDSALFRQIIAPIKEKVDA